MTGWLTSTFLNMSSNSAVNITTQTETAWHMPEVLFFFPSAPICIFNKYSYLISFFWIISFVPCSSFCRSKRSSVLTTECIFELPHFTVQATRAQTLLLQGIFQSWSHSVASGTSSTLSESLLNEVFKSPGKQLMVPSCHAWLLLGWNNNSAILSDLLWKIPTVIVSVEAHCMNSSRH